MPKQYLLDSHALFWVLSDHPYLSETARAAILDDSAEIFFSPINLYELVFKASRGRALAEALTLPAATKESGISELGLSADHFVHAARLNWSHGDPWDRLLLAQATIEDMRILSTDRIFDEVTDRRVW